MKVFKFIVSYFKATGTFIYTLFRRNDRLQISENAAFPVLETWEYSPESEILKRLESLPKSNTVNARLALYCYEGLHKGETLLLSKNLETLGASTSNSQVITPKASHQSQSYQLLLNQNFKLLSEPGFSFNLNGVEEREAELYDYDELDIFGNRFLVLDLTERRNQLGGGI